MTVSAYDWFHDRMRTDPAFERAFLALVAGRSQPEIARQLSARCGLPLSANVVRGELRRRGLTSTPRRGEAERPEDWGYDPMAAANPPAMDFSEGVGGGATEAGMRLDQGSLGLLGSTRDRGYPDRPIFL